MFGVTECTFRDTEWPFRDTEWRFICGLTILVDHSKYY